MQMSAELSVVDHVLTVDATTGDPYDSIEVKASKIRIVMPRPLWMNLTKGKTKSKIGVVVQWTSSGTLDIKYEDLTPRETSEEEQVQAAKEKVRADRLKVANPEEIDEESDEFKKALAEVKKNANKSTPEDFIDPVVAKLDDDGNPIGDKKGSDK